MAFSPCLEQREKQETADVKLVCTFDWYQAAIATV